MNESSGTPEANPTPARVKGSKTTNFVDLLLYNAKATDTANATPTETHVVQWESFGAGGLVDDLEEPA